MLHTSVNDLAHAPFWSAVLQMVFINLLLSGDNALIIAMACRALPRPQRRWGLTIGGGLAVILRIIFSAAIAVLLQLPYIKLAGGLALIYIAVRLVLPAPVHTNETTSAQLWSAVRIIVVADIVMSFDNMLAIVEIAGGSFALVAIGLILSVPLTVAGATLVTVLLDRLPILVWAGAALLGWVGAKTIVGDPIVLGLLARTVSERLVGRMDLLAGAAGVVLVIAAGGLWRRRRLSGRFSPSDRKS